MPRGPAPRTAFERALAFILFDDGCWGWTGAYNRDGGYPVIHNSGGSRLAHRVVYEALIGPIPLGFDLDHVVALGCSGPPCTKPTHMDPVSRQENLSRGRGSGGALYVPKAFCAKGHPLKDPNLYYGPHGPYCKTCARDRSKERYAAKKLGSDLALR